MGKQKRITNRWFHKVYGFYGGAACLLCAGAITFVYLDFHIRILVPAMLALFALLMVSFVLMVKKGVLTIFQKCGDMLDDAMEGKMPEVENEETELALLQNRLARFASVQEKNLVHAKTQKEQVERLLADISHQTKTPIANILLYSQLLRERSDEKEELLDRLTDQSEKLQFLIRRLVEMSRLENGIICCQVKQEPVREFLMQVMGDHYLQAEEKGQEILLQCPEDMEAVFDRKWLREAIGNLVDNGIKYTPRGGTIRLRAAGYPMFVRIDVEDTGVGICEEEIPKIFGRFYRSREASGQEGLGLGLYLAREMVQEQKGYIKVWSKPGEGSCFSVFVPRSC